MAHSTRSDVTVPLLGGGKTTRRESSIYVAQSSVSDDTCLLSVDSRVTIPRCCGGDVVFSLLLCSVRKSTRCGSPLATCSCPLSFSKSCYDVSTAARVDGRCI